MAVKLAVVGQGRRSLSRTLLSADEKVYLFDIRMAVNSCEHVSSVQVTREDIWNRLYNVDKLVPFLPYVNEMGIVVLDNLMIQTVVFDKDGNKKFSSDDSELFFALEDILMANSSKSNWVTRRGVAEQIAPVVRGLKGFKSGYINFYRYEVEEGEDKKDSTKDTNGKAKGKVARQEKIFWRGVRRVTVQPARKVTKVEFDSKFTKFSKVLVKVLVSACKENLEGFIVYRDKEGYTLGILVARHKDGMKISEDYIIPLEVSGDTVEEFIGCIGKF